MFGVEHSWCYAWYKFIYNTLTRSDFRGVAICNLWFTDSMLTICSLLTIIIYLLTYVYDKGTLCEGVTKTGVVFWVEILVQKSGLRNHVCQSGVCRIVLYSPNDGTNFDRPFLATFINIFSINQNLGYLL